MVKVYDELIIAEKWCHFSHDLLEGEGKHFTVLIPWATYIPTWGTDSLRRIHQTGVVGTHGRRLTVLPMAIAKFVVFDKPGNVVYHSAPMISKDFLGARPWTRARVVFGDNSVAGNHTLHEQIISICCLSEVNRAHRVHGFAVADVHMMFLPCRRCIR